MSINWINFLLIQLISLGIPKKRDRPYLILDIRDEDQYKRGRIVTSKSYPAVKLSRSVNYETREMYRFKNVEGKIIVIVDSDESMSPNFATTMIQRGYDNVFVLSGGLRVAKIKVRLYLFFKRLCVFLLSPEGTVNPFKITPLSKRDLNQTTIS